MELIKIRYDNHFPINLILKICQFSIIQWCEVLYISSLALVIFFNDFPLGILDFKILKLWPTHQGIYMLMEGMVLLYTYVAILFSVHLSKKVISPYSPDEIRTGWGFCPNLAQQGENLEIISNTTSFLVGWRVKHCFSVS